MGCPASQVQSSNRKPVEFGAERLSTRSLRSSCGPPRRAGRLHAGVTRKARTECQTTVLVRCKLNAEKPNVELQASWSDGLAVCRDCDASNGTAGDLGARLLRILLPKCE